MDEQEIEDWMYEELTQHGATYISLNYEGEPYYHPKKLAESAQQIAPT